MTGAELVTEVKDDQEIGRKNEAKECIAELLHSVEYNKDNLKKAEARLADALKKYEQGEWIFSSKGPKSGRGYYGYQGQG